MYNINPKAYTCHRAEVWNSSEFVVYVTWMLGSKDDFVQKMGQDEDKCPLPEVKFVIVL
jgi:hypothetical protein